MGVDALAFNNAVFRAIGADGDMSVERFHIGVKAADANERFIHNKDTGSLFV